MAVKILNYIIINCDSKPSGKITKKTVTVTDKKRCVINKIEVKIYAIPQEING